MKTLNKVILVLISGVIVLALQSCKSFTTSSEPKYIHNRFNPGAQFFYSKIDSEGLSIFVRDRFKSNTIHKINRLAINLNQLGVDGNPAPANRVANEEKILFHIKNKIRGFRTKPSCLVGSLESSRRDEAIRLFNALIENAVNFADTMCTTIRSEYIHNDTAIGGYDDEHTLGYLMQLLDNVTESAFLCGGFTSNYYRPNAPLNEREFSDLVCR